MSGDQLDRPELSDSVGAIPGLSLPQKGPKQEHIPLIGPTQERKHRHKLRAWAEDESYYIMYNQGLHVDWLLNQVKYLTRGVRIIGCLAVLTFGVGLIAGSLI